jgi:hypothetical protein
MVYVTRDYCVLGGFLSFNVLKHTTFRKLDFFLSSGEGQENVDLYIDFPIRLHGVVLN